VITYEPMGFVVDKDADSTDYAKMVSDEQAAEGDENERRKKDGFHTIHLVGWAQPPTYDRARHTLIWARDLKFSDESDDGLNYDLRVLGRHGVLSVNLVSTMTQLPAVRADAAQLGAAIVFNPGAAYGDAQQGDKRAELGVVPSANAIPRGVSLLLVQPHTGVQVPGKLFEYVRMGRSILAFLVKGSPVERILERSGTAYTCIYPEQTPDEIAAQEAMAAQAEADRVAREAEAAAVAAAKESAQAKLAALGLTAEEIAALSK
jgi:hypothetical protein